MTIASEPLRNDRAARLTELETPALLVDKGKLVANLARMRDHLAALGVELRPHMKTAKSIDIARLALPGTPRGITVSTPAEAEYFFAQGIDDILYAVGVAPNKLARLLRLVERGARLTLIVDNADAALACSAAAGGTGLVLPLLVELDTDGHRAGVAPESERLVELAELIDGRDGIELRGVLTHAGESYGCRTEEALVAMAERERAGAVHAAERLRAAGMDCRVVSVGSTPTALSARDLAGVTEVRAGVYMFMDLVMAGIGVCQVDEIALSVLVSVIGHQPEKGLVITDGGWMALSRDRGTANQPVDQGYGIVCELDGTPCAEDVIVTATSQEHGIVARRDGSPIDPARFPLGRLLRVLPNHACATAAQHRSYHVVAGEAGDVVASWPRCAN